MTSADLRWNHRDAAAALDDVVRRHGPPSFVDRNPGGTAVWKRDRLLNTCYERIMLCDESVPHCKPGRHRDFLYHVVNYDVSPEKFMEVTSLSGSIAYDPLKKELRARCGSEEANIATLALATSVGEGTYSLDYVQSNQLYKAWIDATKCPENVAKMADLLAFNVRHQKGDPASNGHWPLAFPEGC